MDVIVVGAGPAGRALASACVRSGLRTALVDPHPERPWTATYGAWADELPPGVPIAATAHTVRAIAGGPHLIDRKYVVLDNSRSQVLAAGVEVLRGEAVHTAEGPLGSTLHLADGRRLAASVVVHASGASPRRHRAEQTAVGTIVTAAEAAPVIGRSEALLMDWRQPPEAQENWPTFLYAVPLGHDEVLLEETSLAKRPGLPLHELRLRLHARLAAHGIRPSEREERVRFPVDQPLPRTLAFGAAAALVHPATGYHVATSLRLAPQVASAIAEALPRGPRFARRAARHVIWSPAAKAVHLMRKRGLEAVLALPPQQVPEFFDLFFQLPANLQQSYLSGREDPTGTAKAMATLFRTAPWPVRRKLAVPPFR
jgi:lycopene beta-cyclase